DEPLVFLDAGLRPEIEVDASMDAALAEVAIELAAVVVAVEEGAQVAKVGSHFFGRHRGILPALPRQRLVRWMRGGPETRLADFPDHRLFARVVEELHGRGVAMLA